MFPFYSSVVELANNFGTLLENKIISIKSKLEEHESSDLFYTYDTSDSTLVSISPNSIAELLKVVRSVGSKSCILDPLPAVSANLKPLSNF